MTEHEVLLSSVAHVLGSELLKEVTFVGGATVSLHLDDAQPIDIRSTKDVDFIVSVTSWCRYHALIDLLKDKGFVEAMPEPGETSPICRFVCNDILVDVMPDDEDVLGFTNRWFKACRENPVSVTLPTGVEINIASAEYLLATKLVAFEHRATDMLTSRDAEDIVLLINGRDRLVDEVLAAPEELTQYVSEAIAKFMDNPNFDILLSDALREEEGERIGIVEEKFEQLRKGRL